MYNPELDVMAPNRVADELEEMGPVERDMALKQMNTGTLDLTEMHVTDIETQIDIQNEQGMRFVDTLEEY